MFRFPTVVGTGKCGERLTGILDGFISGYERFLDESGNIVSVACEVINSLGECLPHLAEGTESRKSAVKSLFDMLRLDINFDGIDLSDDVPDILLEQATSVERAAIAAWVREEIPKGGDFSSTWRRNAWGGLVEELEGEPEDDEAFLKHCREFGLTGELVERLLELDRLEEALQEIRAASDYELMEVAKAAEASHSDTALKIYKAEAERLIAQRGRGKYQIACGYLKKIKGLFTKTGRQSEWTNYIRSLRAENKNLPAFQNELARAGL